MIFFYYRYVTVKLSGIMETDWFVVMVIVFAIPDKARVNPYCIEIDFMRV